MPSKRTDAPPPTDRCHECAQAVPAGASFCPDCGADLDGPAAYCAECGEAFDEDDRFCSNCGASRSGDGSAPAASESRTDAAERPSDAERASRSEPSPGESERAFRRRVQDHLDAGWDVERDDGDRVVLVDRGIGSVGVHILLFIFTSGIGNLLYGWWHYSKLAERRRLVRGDETTARAPSSVDGGGGRFETASAYVLTALLLLIGGWIAFLSVESGSPPAALIGLAFAGLGLGVAPPVRRRLDRRHGITRFGRQRTVDHRIVRPPESVDDPCVVCGQEFDRGLVRRRRDETLVAGVPVRTHSVRHNHYCVDCARSEVFGDRVDSPSLGGLADERVAVDDEAADGGAGRPADDAVGDGSSAESATDSVRESADSAE
ncbi:double zinc ribbon domain-containing protein [Halorubrum ezzemoulense]|uniref:double zinc ribbon domain-containing protein n=1 Tax=Halorubrum ezzemoulense TaxID=337243 RepID=UPI00232EAD2A|nr:zinc ribbon domain-containing protein [Halorubrum ezzemoulense]MDB2241610.1 zinc ribbon domain-containing protein [Halorubrum ezzemoulense]